LSSRGRFGELVGGLALFTVVAACLIWYSWTQLTQLLEGHFDGSRDAVAVVCLAVLVAMIRWLGSWLARYEARR
jgi:hypothetical protein